MHEDHLRLNRTYLYFYDDAGNLTERWELSHTVVATETLLSQYAEEEDREGIVETVSYTYGDSAWGDLLTAYDGQPITYDAAGYPSSYLGLSLTWTGGRLTSAQEGTNVYTYSYDGDGLRTERHVGNETHRYLYSGSTLVRIERESQGLYEYMDLLYDGRSLIGFRHCFPALNRDAVYYYVFGHGGNVEGVVDAQGTLLVRYLYDAWGNFTETFRTNDAAILAALSLNPLRYRGYVYDYETGLYYLQSRYYDPEVRRFISPDAINYLDPNSFQGLNLYAYCGNDPANYIDPTGHFLISSAVLIGAFIGAAIGFGTVAYTDYQDDGQVFNGSVKWYEYVGGAVTGGVLGAGVGGIISTGGIVLSNAIVSVGNKLISDMVAYTATGTSFGTWEDYAIAFVSGGFVMWSGMNSVTQKAYDVFGRPLINQVVKIGTNRQDSFDRQKYSYDLITRGLTMSVPSPWKAIFRGGARSGWDLYKRGFFAQFT